MCIFIEDLFLVNALKVFKVCVNYCSWQVIYAFTYRLGKSYEMSVLRKKVCSWQHWYFFKGTIQLINAGALVDQLNSAYFISIFYMLPLIELSH